jgi:simple sugar transport system permease protein
MSTPDLITSILAAAIAAGTPILFATLGEILAERAGILNLGVEGMMLMGAWAGFAVTYHSGSIWLGVLAALVAGGVMSLIHAFLCITLQANQVVSGLALTIFGTGLSSLLGRNLIGLSGAFFEKIRVPGLADIPFLGPILFRQNLLVYLSYLLIPLIWVFLFKTRPGLHMRSVGEKPITADAMGVNVYAIRYVYTTAGGVLAGLAGAALSLGYTPGWAEDLTKGLGWIAVGLVIFATWNPWRAAIGAYLFGAMEALPSRLTGTVQLTYFSEVFLKMLPYLLTILVLVAATQETLRRRIGAPAALGLPFVREERG